MSSEISGMVSTSFKPDYAQTQIWMQRGELKSFQVLCWVAKFCMKIDTKSDTKGIVVMLLQTCFV